MKRAFVCKHAFVPHDQGHLILEAAYDDDGAIIVSALDCENVVNHLLRNGYKRSEVFVQEWVNLDGQTLIQIAKKALDT